jgi:acetyl/propionyl-CoA carboxylase alpha subunit
VDSALYAGLAITVNYDSLIAKVIAWGEDRHSAIRRLHRALSEFQIGGVPTDIEFLSQILESESFQVGRADTTYLEGFQLTSLDSEDPISQEVAIVAAMFAHNRERAKVLTSQQLTTLNLWRGAAWREQMRGKD